MHMRTQRRFNSDISQHLCYNFVFAKKRSLISNVALLEIMSEMLAFGLH